ncbi:MAG: YbfB/YjiJ family MFS transporter [Sneathiella sp.]
MPEVTTEKKPISTFRIAVMGFLSLALAMGIGRFVFTPLLPLMQADGLISVSEGGLIAGPHFLGYWLGAVLAARLPFAPKAVLQISLVVIALSTLAMGLTENFSSWIVLRFLAGLLSAFTLVMISGYYVNTLAEAGETSKQGWVFAGVGGGIAFSGIGTLAIMIIGLDSKISWQIFGIAALVLGIFLILFMGPEIPRKRVRRSVRAGKPTPLNWRNIIAYGATGLGYIIPATYLPVMAKEIINDPLVFGWSWPIFGAAACLSTLIAARLQGRFSNLSIWRVCQIIMAAGLCLPVLFPTITAILLAGICVGGTFMIITMMGIKEAHRTAPPVDALRHIAAMTSAFAAGQMLGPFVASAVLGSTGDFSYVLLGTGALLIFTVAGLKEKGSKKE